MSIISNTFESKSSDNKSKLVHFLKRNLFYPTEAGMYGLYFVFTILLILKLAAFILGFIKTFQITSIDVAISLLGFAIMFLVDILKK